MIVLALVAAAFIGLAVKASKKPGEALRSKPGQSGSGTLQDSIVTTARTYIGRPYFLGAGNDPAFPDPPYIDCGLLTKKVLHAVMGITVLRTVTEQVAAAPFSVDVTGRSRIEIKGMLHHGDMIGFDWTPGGRFDHVGIYSKENDGTIIHASSTQGEVVEVPFMSYGASGFRAIFSWTR